MSERPTWKHFLAMILGVVIVVLLYFLWSSASVGAEEFHGSPASLHPPRAENDPNPADQTKRIPEEFVETDEPDP